MSLRSSTPLATLIALLALALPAQASPVLEVRPHGTVRHDDPYLPPRAQTDLPPPPPARAAAPRRARTAARTTVKQALARALSAGAITIEQHDAWRDAFGAARRLRGRLSGARRAQLDSVLKTLQDIAGAGALTSTRMPALFLQLQRNTEFWSTRPFPAAGERVVFSGSAVIFQYYPGQGLQIQPLANFGKANGLWRAGEVKRLRQMLDELVTLAARRGRFLTWEYYFHFGGGRPPWTSAMSQGTAIQSLSRASQLLAEPLYLETARQALTAFSTPPPVGVKTIGRGGGRHYLIYSFSTGLRVLNAFAQTLTGLYDYGSIAADARALKLFELGDRSLKAELGDYDTGAWTLYSLGGREATLEYHTLASDFLVNLCERTASDHHCAAATRFKAYLTEEPKLELITTELKAGNPSLVRFKLSKRSSVRLTISRGAKVVRSASATFAYGTGSFAWTPPEPGEYVVTLAASSFNGISGAGTGKIAVR